MTPLISVAKLASQLAGPHPPAVIDVRWRLGGPPGFDTYRAGHLPGAHYVDLDRELAAPPGAGGRHPLPDPEVFAAAMSRAGVAADRDVVVYDDADGIPASRAWWLLRWYGHSRVRLLDGGYRAWQVAGHDTSADVPAAEDAGFVPTPGGMPLVDADAAAALARTGLLLDARAGERYRGEVEPIDSVAGHIPGAVSAPSVGNLGTDGLFRSSGELAERFATLGAAPGVEVGAYCGSGVTAAHEVLALEVAGVRAALYPGSWSEWSTDPSRPVATGPDRG